MDVHLLAEELVAVAQPGDVRGERLDLAAPALDRLRQGLDLAGAQLEPLREQGRLLLDQVRTGGRERPVEGWIVTAGRFGAEARCGRGQHLVTAEQLAELALDQLRVERDQGIPRLHPLPVLDVDGGDAAAVRVVDHLDPAGRLDPAGCPDHLLDLGDRRPGDQAAQDQGDGEDEEPCERRVAAPGEVVGVRHELGEGGMTPEPEHPSDRLQMGSDRGRLAHPHEGRDLARRALMLDPPVAQVEDALRKRQRGQAVGDHDQRAAA
jgi:hypothetical protein